MNKSMLAGVGIGIGIAIALGITVAANMNLFSSSPRYAQVIKVTPVSKTIKTPRQECRNVTVTHRKPVQDQHQIAGSVLGAIAGGVLGHKTICKKMILTPIRNNAARQSMINQKNCWDMRSFIKSVINKAKFVWTMIQAHRSLSIKRVN